MIEFLVARRGPLLLIALYVTGFLTFIAEQAVGWATDVDQQRGLQSELSVLESHAAANARALASSKAVGFAATSQTQAIASFDSYVRDKIAASGAAAVSSRSEPNDSTSEPNSIAVSAIFNGRINIVQAALYGLETGSPSISVDKVVIDPQSSNSESDDPELRVSISMSSRWIAP
jgi:hypothetical protein